MELNKYERLVENFKDWDSREHKYGFTISIETLQEPGQKKIITIEKNTGADVFRENMQRVFENPDVASVEVNIYSGISPRAKLQNTETVRVRQNQHFPIVNYNMPQPKERIVTEKQEPEQSQQQAPPQNSGLNGFDMLMGVLGIEVPQDGLGGINAGQTLKSMLNFRDGILTDRLSMTEKIKEIAELKLKMDELIKQNEALTTENNELYDDYEKLENELKELEEENERLQKYKPENSLLGVSLTQLGSAILEKTLINTVKNRPGLASGLLGVDSATLLSMLEEQPKVTQTTDVPEVEISGINSNLTPEREQELAIIEKLTAWLKQLSRHNLALIEALTLMYQQDNNLIELHYNWANGSRNEDDDNLEDTEEKQEEAQVYETV